MPHAKCITAKRLPPAQPSLPESNVMMRPGAALNGSAVVFCTKITIGVLYTPIGFAPLVPPTYCHAMCRTGGVNGPTYVQVAMGHDAAGDGLGPQQPEHAELHDENKEDM